MAHGAPFPKAANQAILAPMSRDRIPPSPIQRSGSAAVAPEELAARLASKLCHDFISPAGAIVSGLDLLDDPAAKDMRDDAMELIAASARKLVDQLAFARVAFGAAAGVALFDCAELERLTQGVYAHVRADLDWAVARAVSCRRRRPRAWSTSPSWPPARCRWAAPPASR